jgi:nicotinate-nucleotide adenylyltransferase
VSRGRIGVFGGAFDPPHVAHLVVAQEARHRLGLARLLVVPAGVPPHRPPPATPAQTRLRLAEAAFAGEPDTEVSRIEVDRPGPSYTVDTLAALAGAGELVLVLGADQYAALPGWRDPDRIRALALIAVAARPGSPPPADGAVALPVPPLAVSSSELRRRIGVGEPVRHLVPEGALRVITTEGLYRLASTAGGTGG